jgi:NADPH-dependent ferric siderophore reductase
LSDRAITCVRHELRLRLLDVVEVARVTPRLIRITLGGEELRGFNSAGFDDHVKVFIPPDGEVFDSLPALGPSGPVFEVGATKPAMRDYTPHHYDPAALTLRVDFVLHEAGPATAWALRARTGDRLIIGGPRGSFVIGTSFDWYLLMGDDTALPAIRRRLAELPGGARAVVLAEVDGPEGEEPFESRASVETHWIHRVRRGETASSLLDAVSVTDFPKGAYYAWIACESAAAKVVRAALLDRGADRAALKASGYWRRGTAAAHDVHE